MVKLTSILFWNGYHNIPKKFIERKMFKGVVYENNYYITPPVVYNYTKNWTYTEEAPWTTAAMDENEPRRNKDKLPVVPPLKDWFWFRGDLVEILTGKDAGKIGEIVGVIRQRNWVVVGGLNCKILNNPRYNMVRQMEKPLIVNKEVKLIDPLDKKPCEAVWRFSESGERVRISKRSGRLIPIPQTAFETEDYSKPSAYAPNENDTKPLETIKQTFEAKLNTFEEDLKKEYNIVDDRKPAETFFY